MNGTTSIASCEIIFRDAGEYALTARYAGAMDGNGNWQRSVSVQTMISIRQPQSIVVNNPGDQPFFENQTLELSSEATSGLPVDYTSLTPSLCTVSGSTLTMAALGLCEIQVDQTGDETYLPASETFSFNLDLEVLFADGFEGQ